jgi:hypothetical protein
MVQRVVALGYTYLRRTDTPYVVLRSEEGEPIAISIAVRARTGISVTIPAPTCARSVV